MSEAEVDVAHVHLKSSGGQSFECSDFRNSMTEFQLRIRFMTARKVEIDKRIGAVLEGFSNWHTQIIIEIESELATYLEVNLKS